MNPSATSDEHVAALIEQTYGAPSDGCHGRAA